MSDSFKVYTAYLKTHFEAEHCSCMWAVFFPLSTLDPMCWCWSEVNIKTTAAPCILNQAELSGLGLCSMTYFPSQAGAPEYLLCSPLKVGFKIFQWVKKKKIRLDYQREANWNWAANILPSVWPEQGFSEKCSLILLVWSKCKGCWTACKWASIFPKCYENFLI